MRAPSIHPLLLAGISLVAAAAQARGIVLGMDALSGGDVRIERFELRIEGAERGRATLAIGRLEAPGLGEAGPLDWACDLRAEPGGGVSCAGPARLGERAGDLALRVDAASASLALARGEARVALTLPFDPGKPFVVRTQRVPVAWLRDGLRTSWRGGEVRDGVVDADATVARDGRLDADFAVRELGLSSSDGTVSTARLATRGHLSIDAASAPRIVLDARLDAGSLRLGAVDTHIPSGGVETNLDATVRGDGTIDIARFAWRDAGALEFEAAGLIEPSAFAPLRRLQAGPARLTFPQVRERYAEALFRGYGLVGLAMHGAVDASVELDERGLRRLALDTHALDVRDAAHAVRIDALAGGIDWRADGVGEPRRIGWRKAAFGALALAATHADWRSRDGRFELVSPLRIAAGGGALELRDTVLDPLAAGGERLRTRFSARGFGYDGADGTLAIAGLAASGSFSLGGAGARPRLLANARIDGGEVLYGATYVRFPGTRIETSIDATLGSDRLRVARFEWSDPGTLELSGDADVRIGDDAAIESLHADLRGLDLAKALPRYAASWLATRGWPDLSGSGTLSGTLRIEPAGMQAFSVAAAGVSLADAAGRFAIDGLDGALDWSAASDRSPASIGWRRLELLRIPFGAARADLASHAGTLELARPLAVDVLGGQLRLERFAAQPRSPRGERYAGSFALAGLQMPRISEAFGWPRFPGNLSGGVPEIEFAGDRIEFRGGLDLYVFDGHLGVSGLALERPFGVAPALQADVHFENMDLEQLTRAFSFGGMSGRLFGTIAGLRLVDWTPVAFDAWLRTNGGGRMSYKAVDDLTALGGGGGLGASLQTMALKIFDTFGYRRLGLRCRLVDEACTMGGIDPLPADAGDSRPAGYTIVEGSGLPRIVIVGHRRRVDWPTLVRRLGEATRGQGPVIE